jgi:hypothetical protein
MINTPRHVCAKAERCLWDACCGAVQGDCDSILDWVTGGLKISSVRIAYTSKPVVSCLFYCCAADAFRMDSSNLYVIAKCCACMYIEFLAETSWSLGSRLSCLQKERRHYGTYFDDKSHSGTSTQLFVDSFWSWLTLLLWFRSVPDSIPIPRACFILIQEFRYFPRSLREVQVQSCNSCFEIFLPHPSYCQLDAVPFRKSLCRFRGHCTLKMCVACAR